MLAKRVTLMPIKNVQSRKKMIYIETENEINKFFIYQKITTSNHYDTFGWLAAIAIIYIIWIPREYIQSERSLNNINFPV